MSFEPTHKSPSLEDLISQLTGKSRPDTIRAGGCVTCDTTKVEFKNKISEREYRISGMCQSCQDSVFGVD